MNEALWTLGASVLTLAGAGATLRARRTRREQRTAHKLAALSPDAAPVSLHPVIDPDICIGSFSCLEACPEGDILGVQDGKPKLVEPTHCIGHGKCAAECPVSAIRLVFGTSERGVDLPEIDEHFESNRPGVHIVGELGGMGLIKNAMTQGVQVAAHLAKRLDRIRMAKAVDVAIVGSGPAGLATALGCRRAGLTFRVLEQGTLGGTVAQYPRQKVVMSEAVQLPLVGKFGKRSISKEELLEAWNEITTHAKVRVEEGVKVVGIDGQDNRFAVLTNRGEPIYARKVVLAAGRRGSPKKLGVPGEDLPKVAYRLVDPQQYEGCRVLVVGGGDSALEAVIQIAEETRAKVTISYRGDNFGKSRAANRQKVEKLAAENRVKVLFGSQVTGIFPDLVELTVRGQPATLNNDYVIACIGGELPVELLNQCGIRLKRHFGTTAEEAKSGGTQATRGSAQRQAEEQRRRKLAIGLYTFGALVLAVLVARGWSYYPLDHAERLKSPLHPLLKPSGLWGHGVGIAATGVMMSNFLYAVRKRTRLLKGRGSIRDWLTFHMFVGFMSPLVIAFHAAFQSNNVLATSTAGAMTVVVLTGLIGRFFYGLIPTVDGRVLNQEEVERRWQGLRGQMLALARGARATGIQDLVEEAKTDPHGGNIATLVMQVPMQTMRLHLNVRKARGAFQTEGQYKDFARTVFDLGRLRIQFGFYRALKRWMSMWRFLHVGLSIFLVLMISAHIAVSWYLGYRFIFH